MPTNWIKNKNEDEEACSFDESLRSEISLGYKLAVKMY